VSPAPVIKGDFNCDGETSPQDVLALLRDIGRIGGSPPTDCHPDLDANCDGTVDARDALAVLLALILAQDTAPDACLG
jgi:hypothetical protein